MRRNASLNLSLSIGQSVETLFLSFYIYLRGRSSKKRFFRAENFEQFRFEARQEIAHYLNIGFIPWILSLILDSDMSFIIFVAMLINFEQALNPNDTCQR